MQTRFGDINARFDDLTTRLKALGLHANMNWERKEARVRNEARCQPITKLVRANPHGHNDYGYSFDEKDLFWLIRGTSKNHKERNILEDLLQANLILDLFLKFLLDNHLSKSW